MFEPSTVSKRQENLHFSGWRFNQRTVRTCDAYPAHHHDTLLILAINIRIATPDSTEDKLKFCRTEWEFGFITGNSERKIQLFPPEHSKLAFLVSRNLQFRRYWSLDSFQFPSTNRSNQVKMTDVYQTRLAHPAGVLPWVHELTFSTVKCFVLRSDSAEDVITIVQYQ
jgi:hypothetical protein